MSYITKFLLTQQLNNSSTSLGDSVRVRERERERAETSAPYDMSESLALIILGCELPTHVLKTRKKLAVAG